MAAIHKERERMRAVLRGAAILVAGAVWLAPAVALAQQAPPTNTPPSDAVGPRELQNFSLSGSVTKPADQQGPAPAPIANNSAPKPAPTQTAAPSPPTVRHATRTSGQSRQTAAAPTILPKPTLAQPAQTQPSSAPTSPALTQATPAAASQPSFAPPSLPPTPTIGLAPAHGFPMLPWLLAALALALGISFLLWRRRPREAFARPQFDLFTAPEPELAPAPVRDPVPPPPAAPKPKVPAAPGIVASRLRPSIELGVQPLRCLVEDNQVVLEFEVELFNSGTAPARAVLAEASLLNAGATQDKELISFFANPVGAGERLDSIPPMRRVNFASRVVAPRAAIQEYEVAGRKAFVPVIAFNALYEWSGGKAQTSAAYLVGRETKGEKLGPLHLDLGQRAFTSLGARALPAALKT
jgi:hypothetical protein